MGMHALAGRAPSSPEPRRARYVAPENIVSTSLTATLAEIGQPPLEGAQSSWLEKGQSKADSHLFYAGNLDLLRSPSVCVVGARDVTSDGAARARKIARHLSSAGLTIVSGLAKGVDVNAHKATLEVGGRTVAVIGTPLQQAYPAEHAKLQQLIAEEHLLVSPFAEGSKVFPSNFPKRNRVMAALTMGTIIIEASDSSGTLHQAVECEKLGRWLFILKSVYDNEALEWPKRYARYEKVRVVSSADDVLDALGL